MRSTKLKSSGIRVQEHALGLTLFGDAPLHPLNLIQRLDIDGFLALLNRKESPPLLPPKPGDDLPRFNYSPPLTPQEVLRGWVDEWLDSGKDKNGVEDPRDRTFKKAAGAATAAYEYSKLGKIVLLTDSNSLTPWLARYDREPSTRLRGLIGPRPEDYAREQLVFFLLSEARFRLAKCRKVHCGTYFLLKHWNRQYKRGTLCDSCKRSRSEESAIKATAEVRRHAAAELHQLAAKQFAKQIRNTPDWHKQKALKERIAKVLNARIERSKALRAVYKRDLTGKWVANSKNWEQIEAALRGGR